MEMSEVGYRGSLAALRETVTVTGREIEGWFVEVVYKEKDSDG